MLVACDVDSTLYDADSHFADVAKEMGVSYPKKSYHWFSADEINSSLGELKAVFRRAHSREFIMEIRPYTGSAGILNWLVMKYPETDIVYLSDRHKQSESTLLEWLEIHDFLDNGQKALATNDKREWLRLFRPQVVIDDRVRTLAMARFELGAQCLAIKHNHNVNLVNEIPGIYICETWREIGNVFEQRILPIFAVGHELKRGEATADI